MKAMLASVQEQAGKQDGGAAMVLPPPVGPLTTDPLYGPYRGFPLPSVRMSMTRPGRVIMNFAISLMP